MPLLQSSFPDLEDNQYKIISHFSSDLRCSYFFFQFLMLQILQAWRNQLIRWNCTNKDDRDKCFIFISLFIIYLNFPLQVLLFIWWLWHMANNILPWANLMHFIFSFSGIMLLMILTSTFASFVILSLLNFSFKSFSCFYNVRGISS